MEQDKEVCSQPFFILLPFFLPFAYFLVKFAMKLLNLVYFQFHDGNQLNQCFPIITQLKMKKIFFSFIALLILSAGVANAQKVTPSKWSWAFSKPNPGVGETVDVIFTIKNDKTWHHFATYFDEGGPIITTVKFKPNDSYELVGKLKSINPIKKKDEVFEVNVAYFEGKGEIRQSVKILRDKVLIEGSHDGQACSDVTGQCVPIKGAFKLETKAGATSDASEKKKATTKLKTL
jgi:thiol:disulfide interchange protein DsbD